MSDGPDFEAPHRNGSVNGSVTAHANGSGHPAGSGRSHPPWEFMILFSFVLVLCAGIIAAWTLVGSKSPERLDTASATALAQRCTTRRTN